MPDRHQTLQRQPVLDEPASPAAPHAAVRLTVLPPATRFSLRLARAIAADVGSLAGFHIDQPINALTGDTDLALRLGPDEWLLISDRPAAAIASAVGQALPGRHFALVDISHRHAAFEVAGEAAADVLNTGCPLDLNVTAFPAGSATRTVLGKAEVIIARPSAAPSFRIECWRSFARYLHALLTDAAKLQGFASRLP